MAIPPMRWDLFASVALAVVGWLVVHTLNARRDLTNKRRELRVQFLIEAWRGIERAANRSSSDVTRGLEQALADVQLFGAPAQAEFAAQIAREMAATRQASVDALLEQLRTDLRKEMRLGPAKGPLVYLRITHHSTEMQPLTFTDVHANESASARAGD